LIDKVYAPLNLFARQQCIGKEEQREWTIKRSRTSTSKARGTPSSAPPDEDNYRPAMVSESGFLLGSPGNVLNTPVRDRVSKRPWSIIEPILTTRFMSRATAFAMDAVVISVASRKLERRHV
jgi:hypothetical protein